MYSLCIGHADCLAFALELMRSPYGLSTAEMMYIAIMGGDLPCVEVLVPDLPTGELYFHAARRAADRYSFPQVSGCERPMAPNQLDCFQHLFDSGCRIHPGTLISAAMHGDTDFVRWLHNRGVPLWTYAREVRPRDKYGGLPTFCARNLYEYAKYELLTIPDEPEAARHMWGALMYGAAHGAPLTPIVVEMLKARRSAACAVLLSFHAASRLCQGKGTPEDRAAWAVMGRMPSELVNKILVLADLEMTESLYHILRDAKIIWRVLRTQSVMEEEAEDLKKIEASEASDG
jgi:hypothetical protein